MNLKEIKSSVFSKIINMLALTSKLCFFVMSSFSAAAQSSAGSASPVTIGIPGPFTERPQTNYCSYFAEKMKELERLNGENFLYIYPSRQDRSIIAVPLNDPQLNLEETKKSQSKVHEVPVLRIENRIRKGIFGRTERQPVLNKGKFSERDVKKEVITSEDYKEIDELNQNTIIDNLRDEHPNLIPILSIPFSRKVPECLIGTQYSMGLVPGGTARDGEKFQEDLNYTRIAELFRALCHGSQPLDTSADSSDINKPGTDQRELLLLPGALLAEEGTKMCVLEADDKIQSILPILRSLAARSS